MAKAKVSAGTGRGIFEEPPALAFWRGTGKKWWERGRDVSHRKNKKQLEQQSGCGVVITRANECTICPHIKRSLTRACLSSTNTSHHIILSAVLSNPWGGPGTGGWGVLIWTECGRNRLRGLTPTGGQLTLWTLPFARRRCSSLHHNELHCKTRRTSRTMR